MKKDIKIFTGLDESQIDEILQYSAHYSDTRLENMKNKVLLAVEKEAAAPPVKFRFKKMMLASIAAILMIGTFVVQASELDISRILQLLSSDNPYYVAQYVDNLNNTAIDNGLELNLLGAYRDEENLTVFYTLTDTTANRLTGENLISSKLYFEIQEPLGESVSYGGSDKMASYDPDTKTATFISSFDESKNLYDLNENVEFNIHRLEMGQQNNTYTEQSINVYEMLSDYTATVNPEKVYYFSAMGSALAEMIHEDGVTLLQGHELNIPFEHIDWATITNIGFVNGNLHVQVKPSADTDNRIQRLHFVNEQNEIVYGNMDGDADTDKVLYVSHGFIDGTDNYGEFDEYIFYSISSPEQIKNLSIQLETTEYLEVMRDTSLSVSFRIPEEMPNINIPVTEPFRIYDETVDNGYIVLSPLYLRIFYTIESGKMFANVENEVYVTYKDGGKIVLEPGVSQKSLIDYNYDDPYYEVIVRFENSIIEVEKVQSIHINGHEFIVAD